MGVDKEHIVDLGIVTDQKQHLEEKIKEALRSSEILVTTGGVSMGDFDLMKEILSNLGKVHFGRLQMKPGLPTTFATSIYEGKERLVSLLFFFKNLYVFIFSDKRCLLFQEIQYLPL